MRFNKVHKNSREIIPAVPAVVLLAIVMIQGMNIVKEIPQEGTMGLQHQEEIIDI